MWPPALGYLTSSSQALAGPPWPPPLLLMHLSTLASLFYLAGSWHMDSRLPALGYRGVFSGGEIPPSNAAAAAVYRRWRCMNGVAEGEREMASGGSVCQEGV